MIEYLTWQLTMAITRNQKEKKPSASAKKTGKSASSSKHTQHTTLKSLCVTCTSEVTEKDKAMSCDFCQHFTHLTCDGGLNDNVYQCMEDNEENSMVYLCINCKPMLIPKQSDHLLDGVVKQIEKLMGDTKKKSVADTIMDRMSTQIRDIDQMIQDHRQNLTATKVEYQNLLESLQQAQCSIQSELSKPKPNYLMPNLQKPMCDMNTQTSPKTGIPPRPLYSDILQPLCDMNTPRMNQMPPELPHPMFGQPPMSMYPPPMIGPRCRMPMYPNIRPSVPYNGPPMYQRPPMKNVPEIPGDLVSTLVVYNTNRNDTPSTVVDELYPRCQVYSTEIKEVGRLNTNSYGKVGPVYITCKNQSIKWRIIVGINKLRNTEHFGNIYARPYLNDEEIKRDRALVRKLNHVRAMHTDRVFKIRKGEIVEILGDTETKYEETGSVTAGQDTHEHQSQNPDEATPAEAKTDNSSAAELTLENSAHPDVEGTVNDKEIADDVEAKHGDDSQVTTILPTNQPQAANSPQNVK